MKLILVGPGAFGAKHLDALSAIEDVEVVSVVGPNSKQANELARNYGIGAIDTSLESALDRPGIDAAIISSPSHLHASQASACLRAGKHVSVEIPAGVNWSEIAALAELARGVDRICAVGHTRRYNPPHQWIRRKVEASEFSIQHLHAQTFFLRRANINALGEPRDWTDHLLWHHAAHTVDLFLHQTNEQIIEANILAGPIDEELGIALDMSIQMQTEQGKLLTLALSFNNDGPLGTVFRYIGDTGTYVARYDELWTGNDEKVDLSEISVSADGIELQDRDFINCVREDAAPVSSIQNVLPSYEWLRDLEIQLLNGRRTYH